MSQYRTTATERFLLIATIVLLPLENHIPSVAGFSIMWIMFAILGGYVFLNRLRALNKISMHPVFWTAYILLIVVFSIESLHPNPSHSEAFRIAQMVAAAVFVASLCRDRLALRAAMYGYIIAGVWLSILIFLTSYGALGGATATDFQEASRIRGDIMKDIPLQANLNVMTAFIAQGAVVALAWGLAAHTPLHRYLFLGTALFCLIATFVPMSRSGAAAAIVSSAVVIAASGARLGKTIVVAGVIGASVLIWVPGAVWSRMTFSTQEHHGKMEARAAFYTAAVEHFPDYITTGVGAGNFWGPWGMRSGFAGKNGVYGAHNGFFQVTIYWGLAGLLALIALVWQAYRYLPRPFRNDMLALCLLGISVSLLTRLMATHNLYAKDFSLGLGLLVGASRWIDPKGIVQSTLHQPRRLRFTRRPAS
jgi:O-Antigen ligase